MSKPDNKKQSNMNKSVVGASADSGTDTLSVPAATGTLLVEMEKPAIQPEPPASNEPPKQDEDTQAEFLTTPEISPYANVDQDILILQKNKYAALLQIEGVDMKLRSGEEQRRLIRRITKLFNSMEGPFSFYATIEPENIQPFLDRLETNRRTETDPNLRQEYYVEGDYTHKLERENGLTNRRYFVTVQPSPTDLKTGQEQQMNGLGVDSLDEKRLTVVQTIKGRFQVAFMGSDPDLVLTTAQRSRQKAQFQFQKRHDKKVPPVLADALHFRAQSFAEALTRLGNKAHVMKGDSLIETCARAMNSPLAGITDYENPLHRIGAAETEEGKDYLRIGDDYIGCIYVTSFPKAAKPAALFEIVRLKNVRMNIAMHATPINNKTADSQLKNREQLLLAVKSNENSAVGNVERNYKIESLRSLRKILGRGDGRIFRVGIRIAVKAKSRRQMQTDLRMIAQKLGEMGYGTAYATKNQRRAYFSTIPGYDQLAELSFISDRTIHPNMTGENIATLMPNPVAQYIQPGGVILGYSKSDGSIVVFDIYKGQNRHFIWVGETGAGKTLSILAMIKRLMLDNQDLEVFFIDPQGGVRPFAEAVGGTVINLGPEGNAVINPLDKYLKNGVGDSVGKLLIFLFPLFELMVRAELGPNQRTSISRAVKKLYKHFEDGESMLPTLALSFAKHPMYEPLRPYLLDFQEQNGTIQPGIMTQLEQIYAYLKAKYKIPTTGWVKGRPNAVRPKRPICQLADNRYWYTGEGENQAPFEFETEDLAASEGGKSRRSKLTANRPAPVWYPAPKWYKALADEFSQLVQEAHLFDALDETTRATAIIDAFSELALGMPTLVRLRPFLAAEGEINLVSNLEQFTDPEIFGNIFEGFTNVKLMKKFISFDLSDFDDDDFLRPIRIFQVSNYTWNVARADKKIRIFGIDEMADQVQSFPSVVHFYRRLWQRGRSKGLINIGIFQNFGPVLDNPAVLQCIENSDRVVMMRQSEQATHRIRRQFKNMTQGKLDTLIDAGEGECLMLMDGQTVHVQIGIADKNLKAWNTQQQKTEDTPVTNEVVATEPKSRKGV